MNAKYTDCAIDASSSVTLTRCAEAAISAIANRKSMCVAESNVPIKTISVAKKYADEGRVVVTRLAKRFTMANHAHEAKTISTLRTLLSDRSPISNPTA